MFHFYADDGRILTPPKELKPLLKDSFAAFFKLIGHIRFFYVADEIWDGKRSIVFNAGDEQLAAITLGDGGFSIRITGDDFPIRDESALDVVFNVLNQTATVRQRRPIEQLNVNLDEYPSGIRCDMCLLHMSHNENDFEGCRKFPIMDRNCYYGVQEGWGETVFSPFKCDGKQCYTKTYICLDKKGYKNCLECGEYHICGDCGVGHDPGECNLGITAEEVTSLILPYCEIERLDFMTEGMTRSS
jgi:hypothetical protein